MFLMCHFKASRKCRHNFVGLYEMSTFLRRLSKSRRDVSSVAVNEVTGDETDTPKSGSEIEQNSDSDDDDTDDTGTF